MVTQTVRDFVTDAYQLISSSTPTVPLQGDDLSKGVKFLNQLLRHYSTTGLFLPIAKEVIYPLSIGQSIVTFGAPDYVPTPDVTQGRLENASDIWLLLDGVTYPIIIESRDVFLSSYKYDPQVGLPRFGIIFNEVDLTRLRLYPGASEVFELHVYGKFELPQLTSNDTMSLLPDYITNFLQFAVGKLYAAYKGRSQAWSPFLESQLTEFRQDIEAVSTVNVVVQTENESLLNGSWRVRAGV